MDATKPYLRYTPDVEKPQPDESQTFAELSAVMGNITRTLADRYRHAYRPVHAKSHGVVKAKLEVLPGLPPEFAQGLFAEPRTFSALMRFSTNPGDLLADNVSSPRGLAIKVLGAPGETVPESSAPATQDFVCVDSFVFPVPGPKEFREQLKPIEKTLTFPEGVKHAVSFVAREANQALRAVHLHSAALDNIGFPAIHPLGESYSTVTPLRYGEYVAKIAFVPASPSLTSLTGKHIDLGEGYNPLRDLLRAFFAGESAVWKVQAQLALSDEEHFPIEKADVEWPADMSPWVTVATLTAAPQESYSDARQTFVDEQITYSPWHALAAHRPLGGIMRSRLQAYKDAQAYRAQRNAREMVHPKSLDEVPD
jgi:hypothetical protein